MSRSVTRLRPVLALRAAQALAALGAAQRRVAEQARLQQSLSGSAPVADGSADALARGLAAAQHGHDLAAALRARDAALRGAVRTTARAAARANAALRLIERIGTQAADDPA